MAVDLLDAPLRVSWDVCGSTQLSAEQLLLVADRLLDAGLFFITLEADPLAHEGILPLLDKLAAGGCQTALVFSGQGEELQLLGAIPAAVKLFLDCSQAVEGRDFDTSLIGDKLKQVRALNREPALLWIPQRGELLNLLPMLEFCAAADLKAFKLPNQKIGASCGKTELAKLPDCNDLQQLAECIEEQGLVDVPGLQFEVHDLFLWELLQPLTGGQRSEYGGCQAGNSLGHIDCGGQLWPCSSWPEPLGSLLTSDLYDLWQSELRFAVRNAVSEVPVGCEGCTDYSICFGGCRGLSKFCRDDGLKRDLLCAAKR